MRTISISIIFLFLSIHLPAAFAYNGLVNGDLLVEDAADVTEGVDIVTQELLSSGYEVDNVIDHAAAAKSVDLELRPTQVIFARPPKRIERSLLRRSQTAGIDLPLKFLVFEDEHGAIRLFFNSLGYLSERHALKAVVPVLRQLFRGLDDFGQVESGLVTVQSMQTFDETVQTLLSVLEEKGFRIPLVLDYSYRTSSNHGHGRSHLPTLIVFGNPNVGTPLMQEGQTVAIDLPQKFLVWKNRSGEVFISYNDPAFLAARHGIVDQDGLIGNIQNALAGLAAAGAGVELSVP